MLTVILYDDHILTAPASCERRGVHATWYLVANIEQLGVHRAAAPDFLHFLSIAVCNCDEIIVLIC